MLKIRSSALRLAVALAVCTSAVFVFYGCRPPQHGTSTCVVNLKAIAGAKANWALEHRKKDVDIPSWADLLEPRGVLKSIPACPAGGTYTIGGVGDLPDCNVAQHRRYWKTLQDPAPETNEKSDNELVRKTFEEWLRRSGLATNNVSFSNLDIQHQTRDLYSFSCRASGLTRRVPNLGTNDLVEAVQLSGTKENLLLLKGREWPHLEWWLQSPSNRTGLTVPMQSEGYYIKAESEPCTMAILFEGNSTYFYCHNWSTRTSGPLLSAGDGGFRSRK